MGEEDDMILRFWGLKKKKRSSEICEYNVGKYGERDGFIKRFN